MDAFLIAIFSIAAALLLFIFLSKVKRKPGAKLITIGPIADSYKQILLEQVPFYQQLDESRKTEFENRVQQFLSQVKITGVNTIVEDLDKVLIASSAVIPIFNFPGWEYIHLHEVLLYPDSFNHEFEQQGYGRDVLGMVGSGALNHVMILSQHQLRQAFINKTGKENTAIHEFVHLVDKTDGDIDGIPAFILEKRYIQPWLQLMQHEIKLINQGQSDINPYGATNEAEFFAVVSEYFFERPKLLKEKHPVLHELLEKIFSKQPAIEK
ncbi:MAG TPA: M90 family metallopeptidase [Chitinophagaceae bacterium]